MPTDIAHKYVAGAPREQKSFAVPQVGTPDDQPGVIEAIVGVFGNVDHGGDRVRPGFFAKSIARKLPKIAWGHDHLTPVGKTLEARELHPGDPALPASLASLGGLYVKGQFNLDTQRGREAYSDVKFGSIDEFSFGYRATEFEIDKRAKIRDLIEGDIFEWSPVLAGMNDRTQLLSVKSHESTKSAKAEKVSRGADPVAGKTFLERSREMVAVIGEFGNRAEDRVNFRIERGRKKALPDAETKIGRVLSNQTEGEIASVADAAESLALKLRALLARANPKSVDEPAIDAAKSAPVEPATPAVAPVPAPVPADIPPASPPAPAFDEADILAQYAQTQYALTMAAVRSIANHG